LNGDRPASNKLATEIVDDLPGPVAEHLKFWNGRLRSGTVLQNYSNGWLAPHIHLRIGRGNEIGRWCIAIRKPHSNEALIKDGIGSRLKQDLVLVDAVEVMNEPEGMVFCGTKIVRLLLLDECLNACGNALYLAGRGGYVYVPFFEDRELGPGRGCLPVQKHQLPNQMVQAGSQMMDYLANENGETKWRRRTVKPGIEQGERGVLFSLHVTNEGMSCALGDVGINLGLEILDLLLGPFNLPNYSIEPVIGHGA